jgi:hypothetical protein
LTTIKIDNIIVFEKVRENRDGGGGLAPGCVKDLKTVLVINGVGALYVHIFARKMKIRCCVA